MLAARGDSSSRREVHQKYADEGKNREGSGGEEEKKRNPERQRCWFCGSAVAPFFKRPRWRLPEDSASARAHASSTLGNLDRGKLPERKKGPRRQSECSNDQGITKLA